MPGERRLVCASVGAAALLAFGLAAGPALAQETREHDLPSLEEAVVTRDLVKARLTLVNRFVGSAPFGAYDAASNQPEGRLRVEFPVSKNAGLRFMTTGRALLYDFDGSTAGMLPGGLPDNYLSLSVRMQGAYLLDDDLTLFSDRERWALVMEGGIRSNWSDDAEFVDGLRGGGSLAVGYRFADRLEAVLGVTLGSQLLKSGPSVSPLFEFDWQINQNWALKSYGLGLQIERRLTDSLIVFARSRLENTSYRLGDVGGSIGQGVLRIRQLPAGLGFRWRALKFLDLRLMAGAMAYQQMRVKDDDSDTVSTSKASRPAPYVTLRFDVRL